MRFVLVSGCPRSGTTAVSSWLAAQPNVVGLSETRRTIAVHSMMREARRFWCFDPRSGIYHGERATSPDVLTDAARAALTTMYEKVGAENGRKLFVDKEPLEPVALHAEDYASYLEDVLNITEGKILFMERDAACVVASMLQRKWGYSLKEEETKGLTLERCIGIWKKATRAGLRLHAMFPDEVRLQSYETLCRLPASESDRIQNFLKHEIETVFPARAAKSEPFDEDQRSMTLAATVFERRLMRGEKLDGARGIGRGGIVLLSGSPGAGKTTISKLLDTTIPCIVLEGYELRIKLWPELGYDLVSRVESVARATRLAARLAREGSMVILTLAAPGAASRVVAKKIAKSNDVNFLDVQVHASPEVLAARRPNKSKWDGFIDVPYEPTGDQFLLDTTASSSVDSATAVRRLIEGM